MVTLIVPTKNRADFVRRLLAYYVAVGLRGSLLVADASAEDDAERIRAAVAAHAGTLNVRMVPCPGIDVAGSVRLALQQCTAPYAMVLPDDDFVTPRGLAAAVDFLERNEAYSAATGSAAFVEMGNGAARGTIVAAGPYRQRSIEGPTAAARLLDHLQNYSVTLFAVHRRVALERMFAAGDFPDRSFAHELLPCCLTIIEGNVKRLDGLYLVRSIHPRRYSLGNVFDWITGTHWHAGYVTFSETLAQRIAACDRVTLDDARAVVKRAFWEYLRIALDAKFPAPAGASAGWNGRASRVAARIARAPTAARAVRELRAERRARAALSLSQLRNPASPYFRDFRPIDELIRQHVTSASS